MSPHLGVNPSTFELAFENVIDAIIVISDRGIIQDCNPATSRLFGYAKSELIDQNVAILMTERDRAYHDGYIENYLGTGDAKIIGIGREVVARAKDGQEFPARLAVAEDKRRKMFVGILSDISAARDARKETATMLKRFQDFAYMAADWFWETDADHTYSYISERIWHSTGLPMDHFLGTNRLEDLRQAEDQELARAHIDAIRARKPFSGFEYWINHPIGRRCFSLSGIPNFDESGSFLGYRGVGRDITELREQQRELESAQAEAVRANAEKTRFLNMTNHELRSPLNAILGYSDPSHVAIYRDNPEKVADALAAIHHSGTLLIDMVNSLLDVSRIEAGKYEVDCDTVDVAKLVEEVALLAQGMQDRFGVQCRIPEAGFDFTIHSDKRLILQILTNFLSNAMKYGGEAPVELRIEKENGTCFFDVIDQGPGMSAAAVERAFQLYGQPIKANDPRRAGSGLGLPLAKMFAGLIGGTVSLISAEGKGTTARLTLPVDCRPPETAG